MTDLALRDRRREVLERPDLRGAQFCRALTAHTDAWLSSVADKACGGNHRHLALVAVGGYGRGELCPYSDLDVVLVHTGHGDVGQIADDIWYPVWDQGISLDHSVRRPREVLDMAGEDLRVALGLLDGRRVWGDHKVADPLLAEVVERWRSTLGSIWLPTLAEQMADRHRTKGDVAFLLEPDLKEGRGGLRDFNVWRAIATYAPALGDYVDLEAMAAAAQVLLEVRVELHRATGRAEERLLLQDQDQIAAALGQSDADALMATVATVGRRIAWLSDEAWRRRPLWDPSPPPGAKWRGLGRLARRRPPTEHPGALGPPSAPTPVEPGIVVAGGEAALDPTAPVRTDPSLAFRLAAVAAEGDLPIAFSALDRLGDAMPPLPDPWPPEVRQALVRVLMAGKPAIAALETLDQQDLMVRLVPEWRQVRNRPQRNAYHRFTVDRHLLEAAAGAAALADRVQRPDLLVVGTLLHDIGKGSPGDHTEVGIALVGTIATRMGFGPSDVRTLQELVRHHLLLPDMATRRDLDDPRTIETVAREVGDPETLDLLAALTEADATATGPAAWGTWKAGLVGDLVERVRQYLGGQPAPHAPPALTEVHREMVRQVHDSGRPQVTVDPPWVTVAAPDRRGLLASVAGLLALKGLSVRSADATAESGVAVEVFIVESKGDRWPDPAVLAEALDRASEHESLEGRLADKARDYAVGRRPATAHPVEPQVSVHNDASATSTVIEVRAVDEVGLLHRVTKALFDCHLDVVAARVATLGSEVVDAFYVRDASGQKVQDPAELTRVEDTVCAAVRAS